MTDFSDFKNEIAEWHNRQDWLTPDGTDPIVVSFIRMAEEKLNAELRIGRMIQQDDGLIVSRCAPLPDDWLEMSLVRITNINSPTGFMPVRYKSRDEFFNLPDKWSRNFYTYEGRQIFFGGTPDSVNGVTYRLSYYGEVPVFSDAQDSWVYTKYPSLYLSAASIGAYAHAVGEEQQAAGAKAFTEDQIQKLNNEWTIAKTSGSRITRSRHRSFG